MEAFLSLHGPTWGWKRAYGSYPKEILAEYGGKGWPLTKSLIFRQKIGGVVIHVLNGDGKASYRNKFGAGSGL